MKYNYTSIINLRRKVFTEIARLGYDLDDYSNIDENIRQLPFKIIPGEEETYRESIFLERAIISERIRLAFGLPLRSITEAVSATKGINNAIQAKKYYEPPLINIIKFACNKCPEKRVQVSDQCRGCLAHPCVEVCPVKAVSMVNGKSFIDQSKCIKCGLCVEACPYNAIIKMERPCASVCGVKAIGTDSLGRADIDQDKCVSCGMCMANCPFGAISDKAQIFQLIQALKSEKDVYVEIAPAFVGQFGNKVTPFQLTTGLKKLGFKGVYEVAVGADLCTISEAEDFLENVPEKIKWMGTSCCPSWSVMAKKRFPELKNHISMTMTPMVFTARLIKQEHPDAMVCFVGPCAAKKLEASRTSVRSHVDFVLTFEELMGMISAKEIDLTTLEEDTSLVMGTKVGKNYAGSGGVAEAVVDTIKAVDAKRAESINIIKADGLKECENMLKIAKTGRYDGNLLEGMACPGGCIGGTGTLMDPAKNVNNLHKYADSTDKKHAYDSEFSKDLENVYQEWLDKWEG